MPISRSLQFFLVMMLVLVPLVKFSPDGMLAAGYEAARDDLRAALGRADRDGRLDDGRRQLDGLLSPAPDGMAFTQENVDRNIRTAQKGYRLLRRVTRDAMVKNLMIRPAQAIERLGDAVGDELSKASLANLKRAYDDPFRLPPALEKLLRG